VISVKNIISLSHLQVDPACQPHGLVLLPLVAALPVTWGPPLARKERARPRWSSRPRPRVGGGVDVLNDRPSTVVRSLPIEQRSWVRRRPSAKCTGKACLDYYSIPRPHSRGSRQHWVCPFFVLYKWMYPYSSSIILYFRLQKVLNILYFLYLQITKYPVNLSRTYTYD
jgi:hypothetical protein